VGNEGRELRVRPRVQTKKMHRNANAKTRTPLLVRIQARRLPRSSIRPRRRPRRSAGHDEGRIFAKPPKLFYFLGRVCFNALLSFVALKLEQLCRDAIVVWFWPRAHRPSMNSSASASPFSTCVDGQALLRILSCLTSGSLLRISFIVAHVLMASASFAASFPPS